MKAKKLISMFMIAGMLISCIPKPVNASVVPKSGTDTGTISPSLKLKNPFIGSKYYEISLNSNYVLSSSTVIGVNDIIVASAKGTGDRFEDSALDLDKLTIDDCTALVGVLNEASTNNYTLNSSFAPDEIAEYFGYGEKEDTDGKAASTVLRDCFLIKAVLLAKDAGLSEISKVNDFITDNKDNFTEFSGLVGKQLGCDDMDELTDWFDSQIGSADSEATTIANEKSVGKLSEINFDSCDDTYKHLIATQILVTQSSDPIDLSSKFLSGASSEYGDVTERKIVDGDSDEIALLNKVLTSAYDMGDSNNMTFKACMSLVLQRGSKYSYESGVTVNTKEIKDKMYTEGSDSTGSSNADKPMEEALIQAQKILKDNPSVKDEYQKLYLTMPQRVKYSIYLMSATGTADGIVDKYKEVDDLCRTSGDKDFTLTAEPYILNAPADITHFQGYVYLNNIANDITKMAQVILPLTYKIKKQEDVATMQVQLAELRSAEEANNLMNNPDQLEWLNKYPDGDKYSLDNSKKLSPIEDSWNKEITFKVDGNDVTTSLKEEYDRLTKLGVKFPDMEKLSGSAEHPLNKDYFDLNKKQLSSPIRIGMALSATYIPFKTNLYNPVTYKEVKDDTDFFKFHAIYGNYRKALYIDTDIASASKLHTTGKVGSLRVATLKDLLECEKDITLYSDDNFYSANKLDEYKKEGINRVSNVSKENEEEESLSQKIVGAFSINLLDMLKTNEKSDYCDRLKGVDSYATTKQPSYKQKSSTKEEIVLTGKDIDSFVDVDKQKDISYNVMRGYAVTSSVYRDKALYDYLESRGRAPVFVSSKKLASGKGVQQSWRNTYFNYTLLKNIKGDLNVSYKSKLDEGKPVYVDIYGNIVTESGNVVVPAAANATLNSKYCPYTAAFITTYGKKFSIPSTLDFVGNSSASQVMEISQERKRWEFAEKSINGVADLNALSTASDKAIDTLFNLYAQNIKQGNIQFDILVPDVVMEVLRGAPIESIDKSYEGLLVGVNVSKAGIAKAVQLSDLKKSLDSKGQNAILALPNLAYMDGIEYVIFFIYRISLLVVIVMILWHIIQTAMCRGLGFSDLIRTGITIGITVLAIYLVPKVFNYSYYAVNKVLLQDNVLKTAVLNEEKREAGVEVGIVSTSEPNINSKLYLKLKDVNVPWYLKFRDMMTTKLSSTLTDVYKKYAENDLAFGQEDFEFRNGGLYIDINKLFDEATVTFNAKYDTIYAASKGDTPASFYTPYFTFLHGLCVDVNTYNKASNTYSYSTQVYGGGKVKSLGLISAYFSSDAFIGNNSDGNENDDDILHLREIYKTKGTIDNSSIYTPSDVELMHKSNWVNENLTEDEIEDRIHKVNKHIKVYVAKNKDLLGRVSDETFMKAMALDLSCYYNRKFNIGSAESVEIYSMSTDDIIRFSIAPSSDVIENSPLSYTRFIYEESGIVGIYAAAVLEAVNFIGGWVKPLVTLLIFIIGFLSLFIYKIVLRNQTRANRGYIMLLGSLCFINIVYALAIKLCTLIANINVGASSVVCLIFITVVQCSSIILYLYILVITIRNWRDLGNAEFSNAASSFISNRKGFKFDSDKMHKTPALRRLRTAILKKSRRRKSMYNDDYDYEADYSNYGEKTRRESYSRHSNPNKNSSSTRAKDKDSSNHRQYKRR